MSSQPDQLLNAEALQRLRRQVMSTSEAAEFADTVEALVSAAREVDDHSRETTVFHLPLDNAIKKLTHALTTPAADAPELLVPVNSAMLKFTIVGRYPAFAAVYGTGDPAAMARIDQQQLDSNTVGLADLIEWAGDADVQVRIEAE
jgi:hypothetical protein